MIITSDFEVTTHNNGNPFDVRNKAVCLAWKEEDKPSDIFWLVYPHPKPDDLHVFFNAKFDLHWYRKVGNKLPSKVWCCQVAEFILNGQKERYPSLENTAIKYGLGHKLDVVKTEYWDKGIQTDAIPKEVLAEYACQDVDLTYKVYQKQLEQFQKNPLLFKLFKLQMLDLLVLEEMEWNGLIYDEALCMEKAQALDDKIQTITKQLSSVYPNIPINFNSGDQLSAFLYGGNIVEEYKEHVGFYKTGLKAGQPKFQNKERVHKLPQLVKPIPNSQLKKAGVYSTDETTLRKLKGVYAKKYVKPLLELSELEKLNSTYYKGIPNINKEMHWPEKMIHGQFNQCVAGTGRLSSSKPNLQNFATECQDVFVSRYDS